VVATVLLAVASLCLPYALAARLAGSVAPLQIVLVLGSGALCLRRGVRQAKYFMLAWTVLMVGAACFTLKQFGLLPNSFLFTYGLQVGSAAEVILLSMALAHRMRLLKDENVRIQREAAELLEQRVQQRTLELHTALHDLGEASEQLKTLSRTDALTGVHNRAFFNERLSVAWQSGMRSGSSVGLIMLDIDFFKAINDRYGHLGGDACLVTVADCIRGTVHRIEDGCFRYGGEEFAVLLPHTNAAGVMVLAQRILAALREREIDFDGQVWRITASLGVACATPGIGEAASALIARADAALYAAKQAGRNRIELAPPVATGDAAAA
jgi:diguanylate cyclase (GGDEF)-like protein